MKIIKLAMLSLLSLLCMPVYAAPPTINIGTIGFPPYGIDNQGELSGIYFDAANILVTDAGYTSNNKVSPYARLIKEIKYGKIDMTIMFRYPELEDYVDYVMPLPSLKTVVIGLQGSTFKDVESLTNKKIAYLRGAKFSDDIDNNSAITKLQVNDFLQGIKMIIAGRVDAIIGPLDPILSASLQIEEGVVFGEPLIVDLRTPWVQVSKKRQPYIDIDKLKQSFSKMQSTDTLNILRAKYLTPTH